ncbi:MAG: VWA domain-containing protein [Nitrospina sp.]|nr:MAG: VWA domain-containing protein [Nitrospina sp.]
MNLNFISPWFLFGLLGIGLPILIHLLTRRQQSHIKFSAVYLLQQVKKRSVKKSRPNRLLLLLFRCLAIACLSLALANPIFSFSPMAQFLPSKPTANVLILDDSYSMAMTGTDQSLYDHAVDLMTTWLDRARPNNTYSLILASNPPRVAMDWTTEPRQILKRLQGTRPSYQTTQLSQAVALAYRQLSVAEQAVKRIYILTDLDSNGWSDFPALPPGNGSTAVTIIDLFSRQQGLNETLVEKVALSQEFLTNRRVIRVQARVTNLLKDRPLQQILITLTVNGKKVSEDYLDLPAGGRVEKVFTFPYLKSIPLTGRIETQSDALTVDNRRLFSYQPDQKIKVLVIDGDPRGVSHQNESFYVEKALNPFSAAVSDIEPTVSTLSELPHRDLDSFSVVMMCNVRELPFGYERELERFVLNGGALFIALGDQVDATFYNDKMGVLLPVKLQALNQVAQHGEPFRLLAETSDHKVLKVFSDKTLKAMSRIGFSSIYSVEPRPGREFTTPMKFTNQFPAVVESNFGRGKVVLYVSSIDRDWNTFPIQPTFLPWVQRWVRYIAQSLESITRQDLLIGEPIVLNDAGDLTWVESPDGRITAIKKTADSKAIFKETLIPGTYRMYHPAGSSKAVSPENIAENSVTRLPAGARRFANFTINIDPAESTSGKISENEIRELFSGIPVQQVRDFDELHSATMGEGTNLTTPLFLMVALMLFLEGWLVRRE